MRYRITKNQAAMLLAGKPLRINRNMLALKMNNKNGLDQLRMFVSSHEVRNKYSLIYDSEEGALTFENKEQ